MIYLPFLSSLLSDYVWFALVLILLFSHISNLPSMDPKRMFQECFFMFQNELKNRLLISQIVIFICESRSALKKEIDLIIIWLNREKPKITKLKVIALRFLKEKKQFHNLYSITETSWVLQRYSLVLYFHVLIV